MVNPFKIAQDCSEIKPLSGGFTKIIIRSKSSDSGNINNGDSFIELMMDMLAERMALDEQ